MFADIYNLRFIKPIDIEYFNEISRQYQSVVFAEDGMLAGGIGEYLAICYKKIVPDGKCIAVGFPDQFLAQGKRSEVLADAGLAPDDLSRYAYSVL